MKYAFFVEDLANDSVIKEGSNPITPVIAQNMPSVNSDYFIQADLAGIFDLCYDDSSGTSVQSLTLERQNGTSYVLEPQIFEIVGGHPTHPPGR